MRLALAVLALTAMPAMAQQPCAPSRAAMAGVISGGKYQEQPVIQGMASDGQYRFELWANPDTGTWTATMQQPNGMTCIVAAGDSFAPAHVEKTGQDM